MCRCCFVSNHRDLLFSYKQYSNYKKRVVVLLTAMLRFRLATVFILKGMTGTRALDTHHFKDRAHLPTFIFEKLSCFIVLVVFSVIVQSSELISVWFCEKMTFFPNFFSYHIFAIYVGGASLGMPTACRLIAVSGARLPSVDGLVVRCIKMHHHVKSAITICLQFIKNMSTIYTCIPTHRGSAPVLYLQKAPSWWIYVNWINFNPSVDE